MTAGSSVRTPGKGGSGGTVNHPYYSYVSHYCGCEEVLKDTHEYVHTVIPTYKDQCSD